MSRAERVDFEALLAKPIWTLQDAADYLGLPLATVYKMRASGDFAPGYRLGKHVRLRRDELLDWLESKRDQA